MIRIEGIQHVAVVVTNVSRSVEFYERVLGLEQTKRPNFDFLGAWFMVGNQQLHLLTNANAKTLRQTQDIDTRDGHFAIRIASYDEAIEHLTKLQIPFRANPQSVTGWKQIFVSDPDGNIIELNAMS